MNLWEIIEHFSRPGPDEDDCWDWVGEFTDSGYARVTYGKKLRAHKLALEQKLGRHLREGEVTRHSCHNNYCTNPLHLSVGTSADNARDDVLENRRANRGQDNLAKRGALAIMTEVLQDEIQASWDSGMTYDQVQEEFGISRKRVLAVVAPEAYARQRASKNRQVRNRVRRRMGLKLED